MPVDLWNCISKVNINTPQLRTRKGKLQQDRGAGGSGVEYWTSDPEVQGSNPWGTGRWGLAASPLPWLWRWAIPPTSGPYMYIEQ